MADSVFHVKIFHIRYSTIYMVNMDIKNIKEAYKKGSEIVGFDFVKECYDNYEFDMKVMSLESYKKLVKFDIVQWDDSFETDLEPYKPTKGEFDEIYFEICKLGNKFFTLEEVYEEEIRFDD